MGCFNCLDDKVKDNKEHRNTQLYLTCNIENDTLSGLFRWACHDNIFGFKINENYIITSYNCTLMIFVEGIKERKGKCELILNDKNKYIEDSNQTNKLVRVTYSGRFKMKDRIFVDFINVKNIQMVIYGHII